MKNLKLFMLLSILFFSACTKPEPKPSISPGDHDKFLGKWELSFQYDTLTRYVNDSTYPGYPKRTEYKYNNFVEFKSTRTFPLTINHPEDNDCIFTYETTIVEEGWRLVDQQLKTSRYLYNIVDINDSSLILSRIIDQSYNGVFNNYQAIFYHYKKM